MREYIIKSGIACLLLLALLGLLPVKARAFSIQARGGGGAMMVGDSAGAYYQSGVDVFFYEGRNLELFVGGEYLQGTTPVDSELFNINSSISPADSKFTQSALIYGLRLKPALSGRWRPYLMLGGVSGSADYEIKDLKNIVVLSKTKDSTPFTAYRLGAGMDLGLSERVSIGLEVNATRGLPEFNVVIGDVQTGRIKELNVGPNSYAGISIGLRYAF